MSKYRQITSEQAEAIFKCGGDVYWSWFPGVEWARHLLEPSYKWERKDLWSASVCFWVVWKETP